MMSFLGLAIGCLTTFTSGCTTITDSKSVAANTPDHFDSYKKSDSVDGPVMTEYFVRGSPVTTYAYYLTDSGDGLRLVIALYADNWLFVDSAYEGGEQLKCISLDRKTSAESGQSGVEEIVAVEIPAPMAQSFRSEGLDMKLQGGRGDVVVAVPQWYFDGFLTKQYQLAALIEQEKILLKKYDEQHYGVTK